MPEEDRFVWRGTDDLVMQPPLERPARDEHRLQQRVAEAERAYRAWLHAQDSDARNAQPNP
jgi:hypothetical protein